MPVVSGHVTEVAVANNDRVKAGQPLFQIQSDRYELARQAAQAALYLSSGVEAANGILLFGVSTAVLLSAFRRVIQDSLMKDPEREAQS